MAARAANLKTDHTLVTPSRSRIVHPRPLRDRVSPRSLGIKARRPGSSVSEDANGWPPKMTVMGRRVGAAVAASRAGKQYRMRPLMKWKRPTHDVSACDHLPIDSAVHGHKIFVCAGSFVIARVTRAIRPKTEVRCPRVTQAAVTAAALFGPRRSGRLSRTAASGAAYWAASVRHGPPWPLPARVPSSASVRATATRRASSLPRGASRFAVGHRI
jgi:hypothetical protein